MASSDLTARMRRVDVDSIETELDNQWREDNANILASNGHAVSRNSVLTLVIYTYSEEQAIRALDTVESLTGAHPSRAIALVAQREGGDAAIKAYIATHTHTVAAMPSYGEEIVLEARDGDVEYLPGAVLPLIVPGLPAYLWWAGEPLWRSGQFEALVDGSDRLMYDTSEMIHPERSLVALDDLMHRKKSSCALSDFNWTRQAPWRELVAQFFDSAAQRPFLSGIDHITIEYAAGSEDAPTNTASAYLFAGWLAARLSWRVQGVQYGQGADASRQHALADASGRGIALEMDARFGTALRSWQEIVQEQSIGVNESGARVPGPAITRCVGPGALMSVHLHATVGGQVATFAVARERDMQHASTLAQIPGAAMPSQTVHLPSIGEGALLAEQLHLQEHDSTYEEALAMASLLLGPAARRMLS